MRHGVFARIGHFVSEHPRALTVSMLAFLTVIGLWGADVARHLHAAGFDAPDSESARVSDQLGHRLGFREPDVVALFHDPGGDVRDPDFASLMLDGLEPLTEDEGVAGFSTYYDTGSDSFASLDGHWSMVLIDLAGDESQKIPTVERIEPVLRAIGPPVEIGGVIAGSALAQEIAERDVREAEVVALPIALLLTLFFFRSAVSALLPILIGAFALGVSAGLIKCLTYFADLSVFAVSVSAFLGLGLSIDYAMLIVQRYREEFGRTHDAKVAVVATLDTAGRAVFVSGMAVVVSLAALCVVPIPLLRSVALGAVLAVVTAMTASLFLLPALLVWLGPNVNRLAVGRAPEHVGPSPFWQRVGEFSMRHPVATILAVFALLATLTLPAFRMRSVVPDARTFGVESEVRNVEERLADPALFDQGGFSGVLVLVTSDGAIASPANLRHVHALLGRLRALEGVVEVSTPLAKLDPASSADERDEIMRQPDVDQELSRMVHEDLALITVTSDYYWQDPEAIALLRAVRAVAHDGLTLEAGGPTARMMDVRATLGSYGPYVAGFVTLWNFGVLMLAFRSVLVPLKAIVMNALPVAASFGVLVWVFQDGRFADVLGYVPPGGIETSIPVMVFAILFGLSMDYEVFLLSRIREAWLRTGDNRESVIYGLAHTGRIITSAALVLIVVIGAFAAGDLIFIKEVGVCMVTAIALDVTLVRALLVPATMQLLGDWNWWAPKWLATSKLRLH